jgi:CRP-like cAMP-binding protein
MDIKEKKNQLEKIECFNQFGDSVQSRILELGKIKTYNKNQMIYERGSNCKSFDIIIKGSLSAYTLSESGTENVIFSFEKNSIIGGNLLFSPSSTYPMSIFCKKNCTILTISKSAIELLIDYKEFALFFISSISMNAQSLNKKVITYTQNTLRENILEYLQELDVIQRSNVVILPISKIELAEIFGVQRQSLFRELKKMSNEGLIKNNNRKITLL